jgi:hypothetical protein
MLFFESAASIFVAKSVSFCFTLPSNNLI